MSRPISPSRAAAGRGRARTPASRSSTLPTIPSGRARKTARTQSSSALRGAFRNLRDAQVFALIPAGDPRPRPIQRLHHAAAEHASGMRQDQVRGGARPAAARRRKPTQPCSQVRLSELPDVATLKVDINQERIAALGLNTNDVNNTLSAAWGGRYVNDFIDRGRVKRVFVQGDAPYRSAAGGHRSMVGPKQPGRNGPLLLLCADQLGDRAGDASRFQGIQSYEIPGAAGAGQELRRCDEPDRATRRRNPRRWRRLGRPILSGAAVIRSGAVALRRLADRRIPVPGRALRKLVDPASPSCWSFPLGLVGAVFAVTLRGPAERRLSADRPADDHGAGGQERHPDGRVRRARGEGGQARDRRRDRSGADPA